MGIHEGRLRAMTDDPRAWGINAEDADAIRWVLEAFDKVKAERDEVRAELAAQHHRHAREMQGIRAAVEMLCIAVS